MNNLLYSMPGRVCQTVAVFTGSLTSLSDGMQYGWTSPVSIILLSSSSPIVTTNEDVFLLEIMYLLGGLFGIPLTVYLLKYRGRKTAMLVCAGMCLLGWIMIATVASREVLFIARFIMGMAADINFVSIPMYVAEISDKHIRGRLETFAFIMMVLGILLIYCIGPYVSITVSSIVGACIVIVELLTFPMMPESPYYYLLKDQKEYARKSLQIFRTEKRVELELNEMEESVKEENSNQSNILDLFRVNSNLKGVIIVSVLMMAQHFGGVTVLFMNMHMILNDAESILTSKQSAVLFIVAMLLSCVLAGFLIDLSGRKLLLCVSSFLTGTSLLILAIYFSVKDSGFNVLYYNWVPLFAVILYGFTYKCGLGLVSVILIAELFPSNIKPYGVTYSDFVFVVASVLSVIIFFVLQSNYGMEAPFYLFSLCCMLTCVFSFFYIPETKSKTLEEIQILLKGKTSTVTTTGVKNGSNTEVSGILSNNEFEYGTNTS